MEPIPRVTARVLPVNPDGEVLLLQDVDPAVPDVQRWGTIGGALDPGESHHEAAVREMFEETGLVIDPSALTPPVHRSTREFSWAGVHYRSENTFFAMPMAADVEVSFDHLVPEEVGSVLAWARMSGRSSATAPPSAARADGVHQPQASTDPTSSGTRWSKETSTSAAIGIAKKVFSLR